MENSNKYLINISKLAETAKNNNWAIEYDADVDSFYWTKPEISKNAQLMKLSDDFALYVTPEGNIEGVFIKYAKNNFMEHNKGFKPILENMKEVDDNRFVLTKSNEKKLSGLLESMANKITADNIFSPCFGFIHHKTVPQIQNFNKIRTSNLSEPL